MSDTNDKNIEMFTNLVEKLTSDIQISNKPEERLAMRARLAEAAELLEVFKGIEDLENVKAIPTEETA
jgi:hypothetical protein